MAKKTKHKTPTPKVLAKRVRYICDFYFSGDVSAMAADLNFPARTIRRTIDGDKHCSFELLAAISSKGYATAEWLLCGITPLSNVDVDNHCCQFPIKSLHPVFDTAAVAVPLVNRKSTIKKDLKDNSGSSALYFSHAQAIYHARKNNKPVILFFDADFVAAGANDILNKLLTKHYVTAIATTDAGLVADLACARPTASRALVASSVLSTAELALMSGSGLGEAIGRWFWSKNDDIWQSSFAVAHSMQVPATVHANIGFAAHYGFPSHKTNTVGAAIGAGSYVDFLVFTEQVKNLSGGVFINAAANQYGFKLLNAAKDTLKLGGCVINGCTHIDCVPALLSVRSEFEHHIVGNYFDEFAALLVACDSVFGAKNDTNVGSTAKN